MYHVVMVYNTDITLFVIAQSDLADVQISHLPSRKHFIFKQ